MIVRTIEDTFKELLENKGIKVRSITLLEDDSLPVIVLKVKDISLETASKLEDELIKYAIKELNKEIGISIIPD